MGNAALLIISSDSASSHHPSRWYYCNALFVSVFTTAEFLETPKTDFSSFTEKQRNYLKLGILRKDKTTQKESYHHSACTPRILYIIQVCSVTRRIWKSQRREAEKIKGTASVLGTNK